MRTPLIRRLDFQFGVAVGAIGALILFCAPIAAVLAMGLRLPVHP